MAFSYFAIIYSDVTNERHAKRKALVDDKRVTIIQWYNNGCKAIVIDDNNHYPVMIGFSRIGSPHYSCECVVFSYDCICEHIIAVAIQYDRSRGVFFTP